MAYHAQVRLRVEPGAEPDSAPHGVYPRRVGRRENRIVRLYRGGSDRRRGSGCSRILVASQAGSRRYRIGHQRDQERPPELSGGWWPRISARRWRLALWPGKYPGVVLYGARLAWNLSLTGDSTHQ